MFLDERFYDSSINSSPQFVTDQTVVLSLHKAIYIVKRVKDM